MPKPPALMWYPGDHARDTALRCCSWAARSLWRDLIDLMHDGEPYGHLATPTGPIFPETIAKLLGISARSTRKLLAELEKAGVPGITPEGTWYSRRMVRDRDLSGKRSRAGKLGGDARVLHEHLPKQAMQLQMQSSLPMQESLLGESAGSLFDEAWVAYPRKPGDSKAAARRQWEARVKAGESEAAMLAGTRAYREFCERTDRLPQFFKSGATFYGRDKHYLSDFSPAPGEGSAEITFIDQLRKGSHPNGSR